ncbi:MAG: endopeptidase La [Chloroflexota bacterium]|nr:endopeptidase La [Chloroflexota bacterium]
MAKGTSTPDPGHAHDEQGRHRLEYPLLPLKNVVVFPRTLVNLTIGRTRSVQALNEAVATDRCLIVVAQKSEGDDPQEADLYNIGTLVEVRNVRRQPDTTLQVEVEALRRVRIKSMRQVEPCATALIEYIQEKVASGHESDSLMLHLVELFETYASFNSTVPTDAVDHVRGAKQPGYMADLIAAHLLYDVGQRQAVLEIEDQSQRLDHVASALVSALDVLETEQRVRDKVRASLDKNQREFYLREQLKVIHEELAGDDGNEIAEMRVKLEEKGIPSEILQRMLKEVNKLERTPSVSPEGGVLRSYIDMVLSLPWGHRSDDRIDLPLAEQVLEEDHYGLAQCKERILDFLAVRQLTQRRMKGKSMTDESGRRPGAILCFVGPPGVGKTSLGQSIARAMNRKFVRLSLGGVHDESEIRGHRRTYVGAMPGRIIQALKNAGVSNPVMLLDEIDKMTSDMRGDPAAAMLEVLDPAQNHTFVDHYLDLPYDLSDVLFIATANTLHSIAGPLRDRMEVIEIGGYTEEEKIQIARQHLLPRQIEAHGLEPGFLEIPDRILRTIIRAYTREAGVRELDRKLATICRKGARKVVQGRITRVRVAGHNIEEFLGQPRYRADAEQSQDQIGVATGLAWTEHGGELLPVEVAALPGRGSLTITGRLGDVMQESARAALTYARSRAAHLEIDLETLDKSDIHIHLPEGAIPKDGPSAGITMATALISALTARPIRHDVCMTGEITLTGRVLPIGGLKEKALAAHRAGFKKLIAPQANKNDWLDLPLTVRRDIEFTWVETMDQVVSVAVKRIDEQPAVHVAPPRPSKSAPIDDITHSGSINDGNSMPTLVPTLQP